MNNRIRLVQIIAAMLMAVAFAGSVQAWVGMETPPLHVDGRHLKDPNGKNVLLHGWMQPNDSYFNASLFTQPTTYTPADCAGALNILKKQAEILSDTSPQFGRTHGWYQSFVRIGAPGAGWGDTGLVDGALADRAWDNLYLPYIEYCRSRGLYVVLIGSVSDGGQLMSAQHKQNLIDYWTRIAAYPGIKNADNVMFEILNEPIVIESVLGNADWGTETTAHAEAMQIYMQDISDAIRGTGANNVIWVPGLIWQAKLKNFATHPVLGVNIGYSGHWYPVGNNDPAVITNNFNNDLKVCSDLYPVMITEGSWHTMDADQGLRTGTTDGWGITTKKLFDAADNISWMTGMNGEVIGGLNRGESPDDWTYPEINCGRDSFEWWPTYTWAAPGNTIPNNPGEPVNGLTYKYYEGTWDVLPDFDSLTPAAEGLCENFDLGAYGSRRADSFGYVFKGYIDIPTEGTYTFSTTSDDGSKLYIGPPEVVKNDGVHAMVEVSGKIGLKAGKHAIRVIMFEKFFGEGLEVRWQGPGIAKALIPNSVLFRDTTPPAAPVGLAATPDEGKVWLEWSDNADADLLGYNVYRSTTPGSGYSKVNGSLPVDHLSISQYVDTSTINSTTYFYVVTSVDSSGNESGFSSGVGNITPLGGNGSGTILREWWEGVGGSAVSALTSNPNYPGNPTGSDELTSFEGPTDFADYYGSRVRGYLHPAYSGNYTFWIASDDNSELWLSTNGNPANAVKIASVPDWTNSREWTKYAQQQSAAIPLTGGQKYYIETRHKEGGFGDNLAVAWQRPGIGLQVIPGAYLSPWPLAAPTGLIATQVSSSRTDLSWSASDGADSYNVKRATTSGGPYTTIASNVTATSYSDTGLLTGATHYYVVSALSADGESANSSEATTLTETVLTGTVIGTTGSWNNNSNTTRAAALDGDLATFFDSDLATGGWVGLDLGSDAMVTEIRYAPRSGSQYPGRMSGGVLQASSTADFSSDVVTLHTVGPAPPEGAFTTTPISGAGAYRYVRYYGPANGYCNVAEIEFFGYRSNATPQAPYGGPAWAIPGTIQAEDYDTGGQGVAYSDADAGNTGGQYRADDVDIEVCGEGGFNVGWSGGGEWLEYTVDVASAGNFDITVRAAAAYGTITTRIEFDGIDATGSMTAPSTGGWHNYTNITASGIALSAGRHVMRVYPEWGNLNYIALKSPGPDATPPAAPAGLAATAGDGSVSLNWTDSTETDLASYAVYRSTTSGVGYVSIASGLTTSAYIDNTAVNGTKYYYVVTATDASSNESSHSTGASAKPSSHGDLVLVTDDWGANGVPSGVSMYVYVPDRVAENPPILVLCHSCGGSAGYTFYQSAVGGMVAASQKYGFIVVAADNGGRCWDNASPQTLTRFGGGDTHAVRKMVDYAITKYQANPNRVYIAGTSSGAMLTQAMLAVYPDVFKAGAEFSGVTAGAESWWGVTHTPEEWGAIAMAMYPGYSGPRPRIQLWHGLLDDIVSYTNHEESIKQWTWLQGLDPANPTATTTENIDVGVDQWTWTHEVWKDACGNLLVDARTEWEGDHGIHGTLDADYVIPFLGLDKVGLLDPVAPCARTAYARFEAEYRDAAMGGIEKEGCSDVDGFEKLTTIRDGSYAVYRNLDFRTVSTGFEARVASGLSGGSIELRVDTLNGALIGACSVPNTGGESIWRTASCAASGVSGVHDLYLVFKGGAAPNLFDLNWWRFTGNSTPVPPATVGVVTNPTPANGALNVAVDATLSWTPGANATSHAVYIGTDSNAVAAATTASPEYQGTVTTNAFEAPLPHDRTVYWRVDGLAYGSSTKGTVWSFRTVAPPVTPDVPSPYATELYNINMAAGGDAPVPNGTIIAAPSLTSGSDLWNNLTSEWWAFSGPRTITNANGSGTITMNWSGETEGHMVRGWNGPYYGIYKATFGGPGETNVWDLSVTFSGLDAGASYDIYWYSTWGESENPLTNTVTAGTCANPVKVMVPQQYNVLGASDYSLLVEDVNYQILTDVTPSGNGEITIRSQGSNVSVSGIQVVKRPNPASVILGNLNATYDGTPKAVSASTSPEGLTVSITYDGSPTAPTVPGSYPVSAVISDPDYRGSASATLVIAPRSFNVWESTHFTPSEILAGESDPGADIDGDQLTNLAEYALGSDPHSFTPQPAAVRTGNELSITFQHPAHIGDVACFAEASDDMQNWENLTLEVLNPGSDPETVKAAKTLTNPLPERHFLRLRFAK